MQETKGNLDLPCEPRHNMSKALEQGSDGISTMLQRKPLATALSRLGGRKVRTEKTTSGEATVMNWRRGNEIWDHGIEHENGAERE